MAESRKLRLGISTLGGGGWLGGVNYVLNLVQAVGALPAKVRPEIVLVVREIELGILDSFAPIIPLVDQVLVRGPVQQSPRVIPIRSIEESFRYVDFLYPLLSDVLADSNLPAASWIPDFQHKHLPELFSAQERASRDKAYQEVAANARVVVFSSADAAADFSRFYPGATARQQVLRFVSTMNPEWLKVDPAQTVRAHGLQERFCICCNQFWAHKDHGTLFAALALLKRQGRLVNLVCTGGTEDYRNATYFGELMASLERLGISEQVRVLGTLPRAEQIALVRASEAVVQPSRFEGWSTVVEDAKSLGKTIFLSDLGVHTEQAPEYGVYFPQGNAKQLAERIAEHETMLEPTAGTDREAKALEEAAERRIEFGLQVVRIAREAATLFAGAQQG